MRVAERSDQEAGAGTHAPNTPEPMFKENDDREGGKEGVLRGLRERERKGKSDKGIGGGVGFVDAGGVDKGWPASGRPRCSLHLQLCFYCARVIWRE